MGYSAYKKIKTVIKKFNLELEMRRLFDKIPPVLPSEWLLESLSTADYLPLRMKKQSQNAL